MNDWSRRALVTLALVVAAHALQFVPQPWIDLEGFGMRSTLGGWFIVEQDRPGFGLAALGIVPLTTALGLTAIVFAIVPRLKRSLERPGGETRLLRIGFLVALPIALLQSSGVGLFLQGLTREYVREPINGWLAGGVVFVFALLYAALPLVLERWGLGRGLSAAVLLYCLLQLAATFHAVGFDWLVAKAGAVHVRNLALAATLIAATLGATRRWLGDTQLLPGDPRLDRIGQGLSLALIALAAMNGLGLQSLAAKADIGQLGHHVLELGVAVGGGLLVADRSSAEDPQRWSAAQLVALGSFVLFAGSATALLAEDRLAMPWAEIAVATILLYVTWRRSDAGRAPAASPGD